MPRSSRHSSLSITLALVVLAGCAAPVAPPTSSKKPAATSSKGPVGADATTDSAGGGTEVTVAGGVSSGAVVADGAAGGSAAAVTPAIDSQKFLVGRVFVPLGIVSNNGGSVIGQNTANVIGQNTANIVSNNGGSIVSNNGGSVIGQNTANVIGQNTANVIGQNTANVIGQNTANVIGQNTANVIGQNTANIVSNNGGSVIGQNTANIISNNGGSLGQRPLAYAALRVVDAAGKPKKGKNGQPLVGQADEWGQFLVPKDEIDANCVIEVESPAIKGQLKAFVAKGAQTPEKELEVDMVSTLSATYILDKFVKGDQAVFERLTPEIEMEARQDVKAAIKDKPDEVLATTEASAVVAAVEGLIGKNSSVQDVFKRIEKLLIVVGIQNDGDGMAALDVPLEDVDGLLPTAEGVYTFTAADHRLRRVDAEGKIWNVVQPNTWPYAEERPRFMNAFTTGLAVHDGWLYLADTYSHRVVRIKNGVVEVLAGTGANATSEEGVVAASAPVSFPTGLAVASDGTVFFSEAGSDLVKRITRSGLLEKVIGGGGTIRADFPVHPFQVVLRSPQGLAFDQAGDLLVADRKNSLIRKYSTANNTLVDYVGYNEVGLPIAISVDGNSMFVVGGGNSPLFQVVDDTPVPYELHSDPAPSAQVRQLTSPKTVGWLNGKVVIQQKNRLLVEIDTQANGKVRDIAGRISSGSEAALTKASRMAISRNGEIAIADKNGRRIHLFREGNGLTTIAGNGESGFVRSALDALTIPIDEVVDVEWETDDTLVFAVQGERPNIKRLKVGGRVDTIVGNSLKSASAPLVGKATDISLNDPSELFKLDDGRIGFVDNGKVFALNQDGNIAKYEEWRDVVGPEGIGKHGEQLLMFSGASGAVFAAQNGNLKLLADGTEVRSHTGTENLKAVTLLGSVLYIATPTRIFQKDLDSGVFRQLAGDGGLLLNQGARDTSLQSLKDFAITPDGTLVLLEFDQVKVIPRDQHEMR